MLAEKIPLHELNNALTVAAGAAHQLEQHFKNARDAYAKEKTSVLRQAVNHAVAIMSRSRWDFALPCPNMVDVAAKVREMSGLLHMLTGNASLRLHADVECLAAAEAVEIEGCILNLVKNAAEAIHDIGFIDVAVTKEICRTVCSTCGKPVEGHHVVIEVSDDGPGIKPEHLPRIFEKDFTTRSTGQGVGLFYLRSVVHLMGGHIAVASPPEGTTFKIYLPPAQRTDDPKTYHGIPAGMKAIVLAGANGGKKVLDHYLDDLKIQGIEPNEYAHADFIVYDPDVADRRQARAIIAECTVQRGNTPIICVTNYHVGEGVFGDTYYLTKPFDKDRFARVVRKALSHKELK